MVDERKAAEGTDPSEMGALQEASDRLRAENDARRLLQESQLSKFADNPEAIAILAKELGKAKRREEASQRQVPGWVDETSVGETIVANGKRWFVVCKIATREYEPRETWSPKDSTSKVVPLERPLWQDYPEPMPFESIDSLYAEVKTYLEKYLFIADERYYDVLASFVLASYRAEDFDVATYLFFFGPPKSGKSRALELLSLLSFRGIKNESASDASLYRTTQEYHPTICLDETQKYRFGKSDLLDLLNSGQRRPGYVSRMEKGANGKLEFATFEVFGFKALAGLTAFTRTLSSRCITIPMRMSQKRKQKFRWRKAVEETQKLRGELLYYRLKNLRTPITDSFDPSNDPFDDDRNEEVFEPLLAVAPDSARLSLISLGRELEQDQDEEDASTIEAEVFRCILDVWKKHREVLGAEPLNGHVIPIREIANEFNKDRPENQHFSNERIGRVTSKLGFKKQKVASGRQRGIVWNISLARDLAHRYLPEALADLGPEEPSRPSQLSIPEKERAQSGEANSEATYDEQDLSVSIVGGIPLRIPPESKQGAQT